MQYRFARNFGTLDIISGGQLRITRSPNGPLLPTDNAETCKAGSCMKVSPVNTMPYRDIVCRDIVCRDIILGISTAGV